MAYMCRKAAAFDQPIGRWNTSNVTYMSHMFDGAAAFDKVTDTSYMLYGATAFNRPIGGWLTCYGVGDARAQRPEGAQPEAEPPPPPPPTRTPDPTKRIAE